MKPKALPALALLFSLAGCHSAMIETTIRNNTKVPLQLIEVDYPSASFGTQGLQPGAEFKYRFKVLGSGTLRILYTDQAGKEHTGTGPEVQEGLEGPLLIEVGETSVHWDPKLAPYR